MSTYFYKAKFAPELLAHVLKNGNELEYKIRTSIEAFGGKLIKCVVSASGGEPHGFIEFEDDHQARAWNLFYLTEPGVHESSIERMIDQSEILAVQSLIEQCQASATRHRMKSDKYEK